MRALYYDIRLCPPEALTVALQLFDHATASAAASVLGRQLSPIDLEQIQLPGCYGGFGARDSLKVIAHALYWAAWSAHEFAIPAAAAAASRPLREPGVDRAHAAAAASELREYGVEVHAGPTEHATNRVRTWTSG